MEGPLGCPWWPSQPANWLGTPIHFHCSSYFPVQFPEFEKRRGMNWKNEEILAHQFSLLHTSFSASSVSSFSSSGVKGAKTGIPLMVRLLLACILRHQEVISKCFSLHSEKFLHLADANFIRETTWGVDSSRPWLSNWRIGWPERM